MNLLYRFYQTTDITRVFQWYRSKIFRNDKTISTSRTVSHRKAFLASIAVTVGIGNIAGVGTAIHLGGPGALFWMWISALFGMFFRMASTYMAIKSQPSDIKSLSFATPMSYLEKYIKGKWSFISRFVAGLLLIQGVVLYNLVQANSLAHAFHNRFDVPNLLIAFVLTVCVGMVILGGLKRIVDYSSAIAPIVILLYVASGLLILLMHPAESLNALGQVFYYAFKPYAVAGGIAGYTIFQAVQFGVSRGIFSHMSGMGVSTFLQAANKDAPAMGAFMAAITPFVDTIIICTISGLVILIGPYWEHQTGAYLTAISFEAGLGFAGQLIVILCLVIFAFTTILGFFHISERCFLYLGGRDTIKFRVILMIVTAIGPLLDLNFVWSLSDILIATLIIFHLIPLLYITIKNRTSMVNDLEEAISPVD